jgi:hypothetical protein
MRGAGFRPPASPRRAGSLWLVAARAASCGYVSVLQGVSGRETESRCCLISPRAHTFVSTWLALSLGICPAAPLPRLLA